MTKVRVVFDTNVLISAILGSQSPARFLLDEVRFKHILLHSIDTLSELKTKLQSPKFDAYVSSSQRDTFFSFIVTSSKIVRIKTRFTLCRDPKDDKFLEVAYNGKANYIVTGDKDLLALHPFGDIRIIQINEMIEHLQEN